MKKGYVALIVLGCVLITGGAMALGYMLSQKPEAEEKQSVSNSRAAGSLALSQNTATGQLIPMSGAENTNNSTTANAQVPQPEEFEVYEQYADAEGTMVSDLLEGTGAVAEANDNVAVIYTGWLSDGTLFDQSKVNSKGQTEAISFTIGSNQVIAGWSQGIAGMKQGGKRRLIIPAEFGYGANASGIIPANSLLIFDVELVQVQKAQTSNQTQTLNSPGL